jgi:hypothetical protein
MLMDHIHEFPAVLNEWTTQRKKNRVGGDYLPLLNIFTVFGLEYSVPLNNGLLLPWMMIIAIFQTAHALPKLLLLVLLVLFLKSTVHASQSTQLQRFQESNLNKNF